MLQILQQPLWRNQMYVPPPETSSLKSILGYLAKHPTEIVWIPRLHFFTHARSRMALPPALSIYDTFLVDEWTDFCGNCLRYLLFARTHVKLQKCVQKPLRWVKIHENQCPVAQMWITTTDRQITDTTDWGQTHSHLTKRPHVSFWDQDSSPVVLPSFWHVIMPGVCHFQTRLGSFDVITE